MLKNQLKNSNLSLNPFESYKGKEPYIFVSYSHKDQIEVYNDIKQLYELGYRIWFDDGINPGSKWHEELIKAIEGCSLFLVFITQNAVKSKEVCEEIDYAIKKEKQILPIYLQESVLPQILKFQIGDIQAILKYNLSYFKYFRRLLKSLSDELKNPIIPSITDRNFLKKVDWKQILYNLKKHRLLIILGHGASFWFNKQSVLPNTNWFSSLLAYECNYPNSDTDELSKIAQYYSVKLGEMRLRISIREKLSNTGFKPNEIHNILAGLPIKIIVTTNVDTLMEQAFLIKKKYPLIKHYGQFAEQEQIHIEPTVSTPLVYKLYGTIDDPDSMVITNDNNLDFLQSIIMGNPKVPNLISNAFRTNSIIFIGCTPRDSNLQILFRHFRTINFNTFLTQKYYTDGSSNINLEPNLALFTYFDLLFLKELRQRYKESED